MRESSILRSIVAALEKRRREGVPLWWVKVHGGPMQRAGVPDLLVCYGGRFLAVEVKVPGGRATRLQAETMGRIREAAGWTIVATSPEDVTAWLDHVRNLYQQELYRRNREIPGERRPCG